ncbi:unknown protein [Bathycoccus prasinos]|uniref:Uncharacterized protein n=1 Tax=Bathycoccus prasinos TaxID=41875 RepID=K8EID0_9CHLO|nr:unknown protein [Bathycoccus prasinos]CCO17897.1 unknown protein [Bathycoccus prasinos]|eukprot:XP_007511776.1 unknown protein [Bathycoccus prasinos]
MVNTDSSSCLNSKVVVFVVLFLLLFFFFLFLSATQPFSGLESSVMDKPNVPATTPPIKNGKFSDMTSNMSSFSLLLLLLMFADEDDDDDDDDAILFEIELRLEAVVAERCNLLSSPPIPLSPPIKDVDVDDARMAEMTTISRFVFA